MLIERLNVLLPYQVRRLTEEDGDEIFALQRRHPKYHALFLNHKAKKADVLSDLTSIPEVFCRKISFISECMMPTSSLRLLTSY